MTPIPSPRDRLADCMWLPRILFKARQIQAGTLPDAYVERFCHPTGTDGQFLKFFKLTKDDIETAARLDDAGVTAWFLDRTTPGHITEWNDLAVNLGRPGFPMAERLPVALATTYCHLDASKITSVFEALEADDALG